MTKKVKMTVIGYSTFLSFKGNEAMYPAHYYHKNKAQISVAECKAYLNCLNNKIAVYD